MSTSSPCSIIPAFATMSTTSSPRSIIDEIRRKTWMRLQKCYGSSLHNHQLGFDVKTGRQVYMTGEVHEECLDKGYGPTEDSIFDTKCKGISDDEANQFLEPKLGGIGNPHCAFPLNKKLDKTAWKEDQQTVYDHVKKGDGRYALILYAMEYNDESELEFHRPCKIYYCFELYEDGKALSPVIEGVIVNKGCR